jgi:phage tail-like protein
MVLDPYRAYNFALQIEGITHGGFLEAHGLGATVEVIAHRTAVAGATLRNLPGMVSYTPLVLRYGVSADPALWQWFQNVSSGQSDRRNVSVIQYDNDGLSESFRWNLFDAWPSAFAAGTMNARANEVAIESLTLVYDRLDRD